MATYAELVADVMSITNRPDLVAETAIAVKSATLKAHQSDYFPKDLYETGIQWNVPDYVQSLEYRTVVPRWRAFKFLRKYDATGSTAGDFFNLLTPEQVMDEYGTEMTDICYLAGSNLEIKSSTVDTYMLLGCYLQPDITEADFNSWIALDHPYAIVFDAVATIFKLIGYDEQAAMYKQMVAEQYQLLKQEVVAGGY
jgi:hypothetical protein